MVPSGAMTNDVRSDSGVLLGPSISVSYFAATFAPGSAATANLSRHYDRENSETRSMLPAVTQMTPEPSGLKRIFVSAKRGAHVGQPAVQAAVSKYGEWESVG